MIDSDLLTDLRRPCTRSRGPASPTPRNLRFRGDPGSAVLSHPSTDGLGSGPRRRPTISGTWPPNSSPSIGINHLVAVERPRLGGGAGVGHRVAAPAQHGRDRYPPGL